MFLFLQGFKNSEIRSGYCCVTLLCSRSCRNLIASHFTSRTNVHAKKKKSDFRKQKWELSMKTCCERSSTSAVSHVVINLSFPNLPHFHIFLSMKMETSRRRSSLLPAVIQSAEEDEQDSPGGHRGRHVGGARARRVKENRIKDWSRGEICGKQLTFLKSN